MAAKKIVLVDAGALKDEDIERLEKLGFVVIVKAQGRTVEFLQP